MSAFVVPDEHIHVMIWAGLNVRYGPLRWQANDPITGAKYWPELNQDVADRVGQMLLDANIASVDYRYAEDGGPLIYTWHHPCQRDWSAVELLKAVQCYTYQTCERDDWEHSEAHDFCQALQTSLIGDLPGYDQADTWGITTSNKPAAGRD